jgi:hypothetical protein
VNWARAFFGLLIVAVGALLLLDNLDVLDAGRVIGDWWPVVIIAGGALAFIANPRHWLIPLLLVGGGTIVLLETADIVEVGNLIWPVLLIGVGIMVLFGRGMGSRSTTSDDRINTFSLFSGTEFKTDSPRFEGGKIGAIFGGAEVDLRHASLAPEASLDVFTAFGGVEIAVARGWRVIINGFPIFGGFENATDNEGLPENAPRLHIDATVLFGGLEVKH